MNHYLAGHTTPETAYVVSDYPYGFRLRCKIRYWLEYKAHKGFRLVSQTTNPKQSGEVWNKPKASTFIHGPAVMTLEENGHVTWTASSFNSMSSVEAQAWIDDRSAFLPVEFVPILAHFTRVKREYEQLKEGGADYRIAAHQAVVNVAREDLNKGNKG